MADQSNDMGMVAKVARAIDPNAFRLFDSMRDYCIRQGDAPEEAMSTAQWAHQSDVDAAMAKARAAIEAMTEPAPNMLEDMRHEIATTMGITLPDYALIAAWKMAVLAALSHDEVKG